MSERNGLTKVQAIKELQLAQTNGDTESAHVSADNILCSLLIHLGLGDVVKEYDKIHKWYA